MLVWWSCCGVPLNWNSIERMCVTNPLPNTSDQSRSLSEGHVQPDLGKEMVVALLGMELGVLGKAMICGWGRGINTVFIFIHLFIHLLNTCIACLL